MPLQLRFILFAILLITTFVLSSCREKDSDPNPCEGYVKSTPDFIIQGDLEMQCSAELGITWACDTIIKDGEYTFNSILEYDSYLWEVIGNPDFKRTTKSFQLSFPNVNKIQMRLVGKRKPNTSCDPSDDGLDTVIKTITVTDTTIIFGKYLGYDIANPTVKVGMEIVYEKRPGYSSYYTFINHFPDSCKDDKFGLGISSTYNLIFLNYHNTQGGGTVTCQSPRGWCMFTPNGVDIQYSTKDILTPGSSPIKRRFIGRRI